MSHITPLKGPIRPGSWVMQTGGISRPMIGQVRNVDSFKTHGGPDEVLLNIVAYSYKGERVGRISPPCGGPTIFEPSCPGEAYIRIEQPQFPIDLTLCGDPVINPSHRCFVCESLVYKPKTHPITCSPKCAQHLEDIAAAALTQELGKDPRA